MGCGAFQALIFLSFYFPLILFPFSKGYIVGLKYPNVGKELRGRVFPTTTPTKPSHFKCELFLRSSTKREAFLLMSFRFISLKNFSTKIEMDFKDV